MLDAARDPVRPPLEYPEFRARLIGFFKLPEQVSEDELRSVITRTSRKLLLTYLVRSHRHARLASAPNATH